MLTTAPIITGRSAVGNRLGQILEEQFDTLEAAAGENQFAKVKPLYIIVPTTGDFRVYYFPIGQSITRAKATLADYLQDTLANVGQKMSTRKLHPNSVKIQFVLVGHSSAGAAHLQDLHAFDPAVRSPIMQWPVYTHPLKLTAHRRYRNDLR